MKFLIIGGGNLGSDLALELDKRKVAGRILMTADSLSADFSPDIMIYTPGGGINDSSQDLWKLHTDTPDFYVNKYKPKEVFYFSSNAAMEPMQSYYALIKKVTEHLTMNSINVYAIRVNSLYGLHKPEKCFPNKLIVNQKDRHVDYRGFPKDYPIYLPTNPIVPTPTKWLAEKVIDYILAGDYKKVISIAPQGETTPLEWGKLILGENYEVKSSGMANDRPNTSFVSDILYSESWLDLWKKYGPAQIGKYLGE